MKRNFTNLFGFIPLVAKLFKSFRGKNTPAKGTTFTKEKVAMGKGMYRPLHQIVSMSSAIPYPGKLSNQRQQRKLARQMGRKVA